MDKVLEVQQQVKNNASDLNDYLRDLDSWTKQMQTKDEQLIQAKKNKKKDTQTATRSSGSGSSVQSNNDLSNNDTKKERTPCKKPKMEPGVSDTAPLKSAKPRDYSEWDKFDVEAACEDVDKDVEAGGEDSDVDEFEEQRRKVEAIAEKERGNDWLKAGNYQKAVESYSAGMALDPSNAVLPANRAMALLKTSQFASAETDCTLALSIDRTYVKAFQRRAAARTGLVKLQEALQDYEEVLRLEPNNKAAANEKTKIMERIKKQNTTETPTIKSDFNQFDSKLKGALATNSSKNKGGLQMTAVSTSSNNSDEILPITKPVHMRSSKPLKRIEIKEVPTMRTNPAPVVRQSKSDLNISKSGGLTKKIEREISADLSKVEIVNTIPPVPKSSSKFLTDWKSVKTLLNRSKYLQQFKASDYGSVFKSSLDGAVFSEMVTVLHHMVQRGVSPEIVIQQMNGLSNLPRVEAISMFCSKQDHQMLRYIIQEMEIAKSTDKQKWIKSFALSDAPV